MADPRSNTDAVHARYRGLIERHLDGDLGPDERMELFDHLEECEECGRILEAEQRLLKNLNDLPRLTMPSDVRAQLLRVAEREHR